MIAALRRLWALFTDMTLPAQPPPTLPAATLHYADVKTWDIPDVIAQREADGRVFAWVKVKDYAGYNPVFPVVVRVSSYSGAKLEFVTQPLVLKLEEYGMSVSALAERYPVPVVVSK